MKYVTINTNLDLPTVELENAVSDKLQALVLEIRALIPNDQSYSVNFGITSQKVEDQLAAA